MLQQVAVSLEVGMGENLAKLDYHPSPPNRLETHRVACRQKTAGHGPSPEGSIPSATLDGLSDMPGSIDSTPARSEMVRGHLRNSIMGRGR